MPWGLCAYLIGWVVYLLVVPRMAYRNPKIVAEGWREPDKSPLNAAMHIVLVSPFWPVGAAAFIMYAWPKSWNPGVLLDLVLQMAVWCLVPEHRKKVRTPHATSEN